MKPEDPQKLSPSRKYSHVGIYYLSGTGNSYRVAHWMHKAALSEGIPSNIVDVGSAKSEREYKDSTKQLIALFFPTHGFTAPWKMIKFALTMPKGKGAHVLSVATRAGTKFGPLFLPGIAGTAALLIGLLLIFKGYRLQGFTGLDMPSNWLSLHPGFSEKSARMIIARTKPKADLLYKRILSGGTNRLTLSNCWDLLVAGLPLLWLSVLYLLIGRFYLAKLFFANNNCIGCGQCARSCPMNAIRMVGNKSRRPFWRYDCESCMRCMGYCPQNAVEAGHSWAVILWLVTSVPAGMYLISWFSTNFAIPAVIHTKWIGEVLNLAYLYLALFLSYRVFHFLLQFRPVNALFTYTTLTHIYRRYHEPDTKFKEITGKNSELENTNGMKSEA